MRLSTEPGDVGHEEWRLRGRGAKVWINGIERSHCVMADEEKREAKFHTLNADGKAFLRGDEIATHMEYGDVRILLSVSDEAA